MERPEGWRLIMQGLELCRTILFVKDMAKMVEFYRDSLGLVETSDHPTKDWTVLSAGSVQLALHSVPEPWNEQIRITDPATPRRSAATKLVFLVEGLEPAREELLARKVHFDDNDNLNEPGQLVRIDFFDPEGNIIQLTTVSNA